MQVIANFCEKIVVLQVCYNLYEQSVRFDSINIMENYTSMALYNIHIKSSKN